MWKNRLVLFTIMILLISLLGISSQEADAKFHDPHYKYALKYQDDNPFYCVIMNPAYKSYYWYIQEGTKDWGKKLHAAVSTESQRAVWDMRIGFVDVKYDWCIVMVYLEDYANAPIRSNGKKPLGTASGNSKIILYLYNGQDGESVRQVMSHEVGHTLGLGQYLADEEVMVRWGQISHAPSIMTPTQYWNEKLQGITDQDINKLIEIYGDGFSEPPPPPPPPQDYKPPPDLHAKTIRTSERPGGVSLSVVVDGNNFGKTITLSEGETIQLSGKVTDYYGNGMPNQYVTISDIGISGQIITDSNGNFLTTSWTAKHNQNNMGIKRSTWHPTASVGITGGSVTSEPINLFVEISGYTQSIPKPPIQKSLTKSTPKITLFPIWDSANYASSLLVNENKKIQLIGTVTDEYERGKYYAQVTIYEESNPSKFKVTTDTDRDGTFSVDWMTEHNAVNVVNGESAWNLIAKTEIKNRIIESSIAEIKITDTIVYPLGQRCGVDKFIMDGVCVSIPQTLTPPSSKTSEQKMKIQTLKNTLVDTISDFRKGHVISEKSLVGLSFDKKEAQDKINLAWDYLKTNKMKITILNSDYLENIQDYIDNNNIEGAKSEIKKADSSVSQAENNFLKISKLIEEAKELEKQKFCFLWWCW